MKACISTLHLLNEMRGHDSTRYHTAQVAGFLFGLEDSMGRTYSQSSKIKRISQNHALECQAIYPREICGCAKPRIRNPDFARREIQGQERH